MVRLELLEHLYEMMYMQRLRNSNEAEWRCRIISHRAVISARQSSNSSVTLELGQPGEKRLPDTSVSEEELEVDYVFAATGYQRNAHEEILSGVKDLLPDDVGKNNQYPVGRDYRIQYDQLKVDASKAGIWLQGCNESTHGVSYSYAFIIPSKLI